MTDNYIRVRVPSTASLANEIHSVHLTGMMRESAVGQLLLEEGCGTKKREILKSSEQGQIKQVFPVLCS